MTYISKVFRAAIKAKRYLYSLLLIWFYRIAYYPNIQIGESVQFQDRVRISVTDGGFIHIGAHTTVCSGTHLIASRGRISIGQHVHLGQNSMIVSRDSIQIGNDCLIAERVSIRDQQHGMQAGTSAPFRLQPSSACSITIGRNVWLGAGAFVKGGVHIHDDVVVGANSVVVRELGERAVYAGNPAVKIRDI